MKRDRRILPPPRAAALLGAGLVVTLLVAGAVALADQPTSYAPIANTMPFEKCMMEMSAAKPAIMQRQMKLLEMRYDLADRPASPFRPASASSSPTASPGRTSPT
jgi:hypothetical protein